MKTAQDPRHKLRRDALKSLFADSFTKQVGMNKLARSVIRYLKRTDEKIKSAAPVWPLDKLNRIDLAILRLAIYELDHTKVPPKVVIDEAVELAKEFGSENSASFINGVLATIYKDMEKVDTPNNF